MAIPNKTESTERTFLLPWEAVKGEDSVPLMRELAAELSVAHPLYGMRLEAVARSIKADDALFELQDGRCAWVHLTWSGKAERPHWPSHRIYGDFAAWADAVMFPEHDAYD